MADLLSYFERYPRQSNQILDGGELKRVARAVNLHPDALRGELKKLGFIKTQNKHGMAVWKRPQVS
jgi:hypothetical protein